MSNLINLTKAIQRHVGVDDDGVYGPATAAAVWRELQRTAVDTTPLDPELSAAALHPRTLQNIATLDVKARDAFMEFAKLANATAATYGCEYVMISGNRTFEDQDALFAQGRTQPGEIVTNARGGYSNHNFGIAGDFGVFRGKVYLDGGDSTEKALAAKVHRACSLHAAKCGLEWGGSWKSIVDLPHYEVQTGLTMAEKRRVFREKGSVL